jgi:ATP-dependent RNA helicase DHX57
VDSLRKRVLSSFLLINVSFKSISGKSTQAPQYILENMIETKRGSMCNIICTQPRRISATSLAERVSNELTERCGTTVGYSIRGESKQSASTKLSFVTTGILLRKLHADPMLSDVSHIVIDEVHERGVESDFLLVILKSLLRKRRDLKVILMSATINSTLFSNYFGSAPVLEIPGFTYPVKD